MRAFLGVSMNQERQFRFDLEESFPNLPTAPIVEAVIHWTARGERSFQREEFGLRLAEQVPDYPDCQPQHELHLEAQFAADGSSTQIRRDTWRGFRLTSSDKLYIAQFGRDGLVFSRLQPYETWEKFAAEGIRLWRVFCRSGSAVGGAAIGGAFHQSNCADRPFQAGTLSSKAAKVPGAIGAANERIPLSKHP